MKLSKWLILTAMTSVAHLSSAAAYDESFLTDYTVLQAREAGGISDLFYSVPDLQERMKNYPAGVVIDQPEILMSAESKYKGGKPEDLLAVSEMVRESLAEQFTQGGYTVVEHPGPGVMYFRVAVTDLSLKKKKRGILSFTPAGFVLKAATNAMKDMMEKIDIVGMSLQGELLDGDSLEVLAAVVSPGPSAKNERMSFEDLHARVGEYGARIRCQLDNAQRDASGRIDCFDPALRAEK